MTVAVSHPRKRGVPRVAAPAAGSPLERLTAFVRTRLSFFQGLSHEKEALVCERECRNLLRDLGVRRSEEDLHLATLALLGMLSWAHTWDGPEHHGSPERLTERVLEIFLEGFLRVAAGPTAYAPATGWPVSCDDVDDL